ncbi:hypothetical protein HYS11_01070 [Candidatus Gottesmanbacteria bacterium]|nr:hypothetical protein [Candidatus Gottesmanbacteria bacterium]
MSKKKITMTDVFRNPRYRGKHVILAAGKIYTAKTGEGASEILKKLEKTHPNVIPEIAYLPKARSLILAQIGHLERQIPLAFFDTNEVPALLGRLGFLETFDSAFLKKHMVVFKE